MIPFFLRAMPRLFRSRAVPPASKTLGSPTNFYIGTPPPHTLDIPKLTMKPIAGADNPSLARGIAGAWPGTTHGPHSVITGEGLVSGRFATPMPSIEKLAAIVAEADARKRASIIKASLFAAPIPLGFMIGGDEA